MVSGLNFVFFFFQKYRKNSVLQSHFGGKALFIFMDWEPLDLAEQFTLIHAEMFKMIEIPELFEQNWQKPEKEDLAPNLTAISNFFNRISYWISSSILLAAKSDTISPAKVVTKFIRILQVNFHFFFLSDLFLFVSV